MGAFFRKEDESNNKDNTLNKTPSFLNKIFKRSNSTASFTTASFGVSEKSNSEQLSQNKKSDVSGNDDLLLPPLPVFSSTESSKGLNESDSFAKNISLDNDFDLDDIPPPPSINNLPEISSDEIKTNKLSKDINNENNDENLNAGVSKSTKPKTSKAKSKKSEKLEISMAQKKLDDNLFRYESVNEDNNNSLQNGAFQKNKDFGGNTRNENDKTSDKRINSDKFNIFKAQILPKLKERYPEKSDPELDIKINALWIKFIDKRGL